MFSLPTWAQTGILLPWADESRVRSGIFPIPINQGDIYPPGMIDAFTLSRVWLSNSSALFFYLSWCFVLGKERKKQTGSVIYDHKNPLGVGGEEGGQGLEKSGIGGRVPWERDEL